MAQKRPQRAHVFGVEVDRLSQHEAVEQLLHWCAAKEQGYVVTLNLDHAVKLRRDADFRRAYAGARLVLADGMPIVWASRVGKHALPERVAGADLVKPISAGAARIEAPIFLLGSTFNVLRRAARRLYDETPGLHIAGIYAPPFGFVRNPEALREAATVIKSSQADIVFVALGAPAQEIWAFEAIKELQLPAIVCIGAALDFLAEEKKRAPVALRRVGLEWLWRALSEPERLGRRYAIDLVWLPRLMFEQALYGLRQHEGRVRGT